MTGSSGDNGADGQGDTGSEGDQGPGGSSGPGGEGVGPTGHGADSPAGPGHTDGSDSYGGLMGRPYDPTTMPSIESLLNTPSGYRAEGYEGLSITNLSDMGPAERNAVINNRYDPTHPAAVRGRAIDQGTVKAQSLIDRMMEAFNPMTTYNALFNEKPPDATTVVNGVVSQLSGPVGVAMTAGRALSEYALDQGWSIDYGYESVMGGTDSSERAVEIRRQIQAETGTAPATPEPAAPAPAVTVVSAVPGYRSLLGGGYDGFSFLGAAEGVNRTTRRLA